MENTESISMPRSASGGAPPEGSEVATDAAGSASPVPEGSAAPMQAGVTAAIGMGAEDEPKASMSTEPTSSCDPIDVGMPPVAAERGWSAELVLPMDSEDSRLVVSRGLTGVGLSAVYGVALGAREGGLSLLSHGVAVPAALLSVCAVGIPALFIGLALLDAPIDPKGMQAAAARALASAGLVLAGLAPAAALFVVTADLSGSAAMIGSLGLLFGAALGLRALIVELWRLIATADSATKVAATFATGLFSLFAVLLSSRVIHGVARAFTGGL